MLKNLKAESSIFTDRARNMHSQLAVNSKSNRIQYSYENVYVLYCSTLLPFIAIKKSYWNILVSFNVTQNDTKNYDK